MVHVRAVYWRIPFRNFSSPLCRARSFVAERPAPLGWSIWTPDMLRFTSGYKTTDQSPHHHLLEAQQLGLVHDGEGEAAGEQRDAEEDQHGPEVADLSRLLPTVQTRGPAVPTCRDWDLTMNLYLPTAMAMLVREDMYTATHGKVFTNLARVRSNKIVY